MRVFSVWKRRCADVRAGTQAPPLQFRLGGLRVERLVSFGWIARGCPPLRKIAPTRAHLLFIRCRDGTFIRRGKVVFIFICIFASNKNVNQEQSWNV